MNGDFMNKFSSMFGNVNYSEKHEPYFSEEYNEFNETDNYNEENINFIYSIIQSKSNTKLYKMKSGVYKIIKNDIIIDEFENIIEAKYHFIKLFLEK